MRRLRNIMIGTTVAVSLLAAGCDSAAPAAPAYRIDTSNVDAASLRFVIQLAEGELPEGTDINHNPYTAYIESHTGIDLQIYMPQTVNIRESLSSAIASGRVPDLIHTSDPAWIAKQVDLDLLLPLDELLQTDGQALYQFFPEEAWKAVTFHGKIYGIPSLSDVPGNEIMYARKDWLDAVNLEPPTTLEEYYEVMHAFTYQDPDGNGKNDTWGLTIIPDNLSRSAPFFGAFGVPMGGNPLMQWKEVDGELKYSGTLNETKDALTYIRKLYGDGVLDREFILNKRFTFEEKIIHGKVGLFAGNWFDTVGPIQENMIRDPNAEWIRLPYPIGPNGQSGTAATELVSSYSVIPKDSRYAQEVLNVLTFIAGEGHRELALGISGAESQEQYLPLYLLANPARAEVRKERLNGMGAQVKDDTEFLLQHVLRSDYLGPLTPSMDRFGEQLSQLQNETFLQYIMGLISSVDLDSYRIQWNTGGGWEIKNEVDQWYRSQLGEGQLE